MVKRVDMLERIEARYLAVVVLAGTALGWAGCKEWITAKAPNAPLCREGRHPSGGMCCGPGEEWVPARQACLCFQAESCGSAAEVTRRSPDAAPPVGGPREAAHPCVGAWKSLATDSEGGRVELAVAVSPLAPGTIVRPQAASCGTVTERSSEAGRCHFRLVRCSQNGDILIATAAASESSECVESSSVALQCGSSDPRYRRAEEDRSVRGKLERVAATAAGSAGPAPKRSVPNGI